MLEEARGEPFRASAEQALALARETDDCELLREAFVLLYRADRAEGDPRSAKAHLNAATWRRDRFVDRLPGERRASFLARRELVEPAAIEAGEGRLSSGDPPYPPGPLSSGAAPYSPGPLSPDFGGKGERH